MATQTANIPRAQPAPGAPTRGAHLWRQMVRYRWGYIFIAPWILVYALFGIYPLVLSFYLTFFNYSFVRPDDLTFVGVGNWVRGIQDVLFWQSTFNILYNQAIFISLTLGLGLMTALLLKQITRGGRIFRTIYFLPVVTSVIVLMVIGGYLTSATGPIQSQLLRAGIISQPVFWQSTFWLPMPVIAVINSWKWFGVGTVILLAGLYSIDPQLYESASLDGANGWQLFWSITIPQLMPQIFFLLVVDFINGLQMFGEVYAMFDIYGGNQHQALTPVLYLYAQAFDQSNMGYASTLGLMLAALIALVTILQFRFVPRDVD
ncbi:sugar ABC transporter permease [Oscillochloris sp. ZM17-4]|uniref:carbohydrate ABC transporter permease n=1 Tax=Oscillochloris sp. ZM17-4 TaxID=2866714 RepID=UPI001C73AB93|nr:sugar ABC transporter permease [Oscillochloris sp. ZM17-4]MBX0328338.1 sugar ABC transporter permease [Oscillochloris sp. ZM17-4]